MAYELYYKISLDNDENQRVVVNIYKKDAAAPASIGEYECSQCEVSKNADGFTKYDTIISTELLFGLWIPEVDDNDEPITWETFLASTHDEWKVIVTVDGQYYFHGFITPDEGNSPFQDPPYELTFRATDGLALLKEVELSKYDGTPFSTYGKTTLIEFIAACFAKTGLELPIRIYCNLFHGVMQNKGDSINNDMFQFTKVSNRTWLKDANSFESCHEVLRRVFTQFFTIEYWNGMWQISSIAEKQYLPGSWFYVDYDPDGTNPTGAEVTENYAQVGKNVDIYPINENQSRASRFAIKSARYFYNYTVPEELIPNYKLQRLGNLIAPLSGIGYSAYELVDWTHYKGQPQPLADQDPAVSNAYIKVEVDAFDTQTDRYIVVEHDATAPSTTLENYIRNDNPDSYADAGDVIDLGMTFRSTIDHNSTVASIALLKDGFSGNSAGDWLSIDEDGVWHGGPYATFARFDASEDATQWKTTSVDDVVIPANGVLYFFLGAGDITDPNETHYKDLVISQTLYIRGSRFNMKGDYWFTSKNNSFPDKVDEEIYISDSPKRIIKGGFWWNNGTSDVLLDPAWYTWPAVGIYKHFKEWLNLGRFNHSYRRMRSIDGEFNGLNYAPENDSTNKQPIGFHKRYRFVDEPAPSDFILVPPVTMKLLEASFQGTFVEAIKDGSDGTQTGDNHQFNYIF